MKVEQLWRYPVKSMLGETLATAVVRESGMEGDRAFALVDEQTGRVLSAKDTRRGLPLLRCRAVLADGLRITLPDGRTVVPDESFGEELSRVLGRPVKLRRVEQSALAEFEAVWPDLEGLSNRGTVTVEALPPGSFHDVAPIHLVTTATLAALAAQAPGSRFDVSRFRPNFLITVPGDAGFIENDWVERTLSIGPEVRLRVVQPCSRCIMTTLAQDDLPRDSTVLQTAVRHNDACVGVYAVVERGGGVRCGDVVEFA